MNLDEILLSKRFVISLAKCEVSVFRTSQPKIELERFLLDVAEALCSMSQSEYS